MQGTNGHLILDPAPDPVTKSGHPHNGNSANGNGIHQPDQRRVFIFSAKDSVACQNMKNRFADHIVKSPVSPADLAYTLSERRSLHPWVSAVSASNLEELADRLRETVRKPSSSSRRPRLGFVFNGQGAQWHAMGRELIDAYPVFGQGIRDAGDILKGFGADWILEGTQIHMNFCSIHLY